MRGKLSPAVKYVAELGITPADAGKTDGGGMTMTAKEDHPRGCGENVVQQGKRLEPKGSPPRMRGKRFIHVERRRK